MSKKYFVLAIALMAAGLAVVPQAMAQDVDAMQQGANEGWQPAGITTYSDNKEVSSINWHKILGWSAIGMMGVSIVSGFFMSEQVHCRLAVAATGISVAACINGIYEYGGLISFKDGDWRINTHTIMGILATAGFVASCALYFGNFNTGHVAVGIASGLAFSVSIIALAF